MAGYIYDIETLANCSVFVFVHYKTEETKVFEISPFKNDFTELLNFLENSADNGEMLIGFNNLSFDAQICEALLKNRDKLEQLPAVQIAEKIYQKAQTLISTQEFGDDKFSGIPEWQLSIKQIDVFKIWHYDNAARKSSLKWLQFTCDWFNVQEMPIHHSTRLSTPGQVQEVIEYCINDVKFTKMFYGKTKPMLQLRKEIEKKYKLKCRNFSDAKLGSELILKLYCKKTKLKKFDVKALKTHRHQIKVADILFPYIEFNSDALKEVHQAYKDTVIVNTKGELKMAARFRGCRFDYGQGGIHQANPGVYHSDELWSIEDIDVGGLYPSIGCANEMYPAHLGPVYYEVFKEEIVDVRMREKAKGSEGDQTIISGFKLAANAAVGNTNQKHSWLYDPQYNMQTTINGQLMITMLAEDLLLNLTDPQLMQSNTDGLTIRVLRSEVDKMKQLCQAWESKTKLHLEYKSLKSAWVWDVNNYLMTDYKDKIKAKGRFEYENLEPHKNKSFLVVRKAIKEYFVNGVIPETYLKTNQNIFDYCAGERATGEWEFKSTCLVDGVITEAHMQKVVRFYISNTGCKIVKVNRADGRRIMTIAGQYLQTEYNLHQEQAWEDYNINYGFYLEQIYKEIGALSTKNLQLELGF